MDFDYRVGWECVRSVRGQLQINAIFPWEFEDLLFWVEVVRVMWVKFARGGDGGNVDKFLRGACNIWVSVWRALVALKGVCEDGAGGVGVRGIKGHSVFIWGRCDSRRDERLGLCQALGILSTFRMLVKC